LKTVSCAGYYGTGSSAVTDYLSEFDNILSLTNYEFRFAHDPEGLSDLEYNLVENQNRHNSGHALKRYKRLVDYYGDHLFVRRYEPFFNNQWKTLSYEYIKKLTDFSYHGYWQYDFLDKGKWFEFWYKLPGRILRKTIWRQDADRAFNSLPNEITYCSHPSEQKFLQVTRWYTDVLLAAANAEHKPYIMVDQMIPPSNIERYLKYFTDITVFIVDRDPRDIYLLSKYQWNDGIVPKESVELYCKWYKYVRDNSRGFSNDRVLYLQFEDLIYRYDETTEKIRNVLGLHEENHIGKLSCFNPAVSIKNTRLWIQNDKYITEANEIADRLPDYLYDYEKISLKKLEHTTY